MVAYILSILCSSVIDIFCTTIGKRSNTIYPFTNLKCYVRLSKIIVHDTLTELSSAVMLAVFCVLVLSLSFFHYYYYSWLLFRPILLIFNFFLKPSEADPLMIVFVHRPLCAMLKVHLFCSILPILTCLT